MLQGIVVELRASYTNTSENDVSLYSLILHINHARCITLGSCWTKNVGIYQWIIYIPNLLCLVVSVIHLVQLL